MPSRSFPAPAADAAAAASAVSAPVTACPLLPFPPSRQSHSLFRRSARACSRVFHHWPGSRARRRFRRRPWPAARPPGATVFSRCHIPAGTPLPPRPGPTGSISPAMHPPRRRGRVFLPIPGRPSPASSRQRPARRPRTGNTAHRPPPASFSHCPSARRCTRW